MPEEHRFDHVAGRPNLKPGLEVRILRAYEHVAAFDHQYVKQGDAMSCQRRVFHGYRELGSFADDLRCEIPVVETLRGKRQRKEVSSSSLQNVELPQIALEDEWSAEIVIVVGARLSDCVVHRSLAGLRD